MNTRVTSGFLDSFERITSQRHFMEDLAHRTQFADAQRVDDSSAEGTYSIYKKQLHNLGVPIWPEDVEAPRDFKHGTDLPTYLTAQKEEVLNRGITVRFDSASAELASPTRAKSF
eukprot:544434-Pyramimonas_sp.AAC.1